MTEVKDNLSRKLLDLSQVSKLKEEQQKRIDETDKEIERWMKYKEEYTDLRIRLESLPEQVSYDVMVSFGKKAFMPGRLVHTNEIMVLLGDNWFAERSAKQAADIAARRIKQCEETLAGFQKQKDLHSSWLKQIDDIWDESSGSGDTVEIVEKYDEEEENLWRAKHRENVRKYHQEMAKFRKEAGSDDTMWEKLENLERTEEDKYMKLPSGDADAHCDSEESEEEEDEPEETSYKMYTRAIVDKIFHKSSDNNSEVQFKPDLTKRRVSWSDQSLKFLLQEDIDDLSPTESVTINFSHTPNADVHNKSSDSGSTAVRTPSDIYEQFAHRVHPKSILKSTNQSVSVLDRAPQEQEQKISNQNPIGEIVEHFAPNACLQDATFSERPVSRFRSSRLGKQT